MPCTGVSSNFVSATHSASSANRLSPGVDDGTTASVIAPIRASVPNVQAIVRTGVLTAAAMICFAANSLLCRAALREGAIDAASFTAIRLATGACVLVAIVLARKATLRGEG